MADLVTRLLLDNKNFDKNLKMSSLQIKQFKDIGSNVIGMLGKFGGAIGIAMGATEGFNKWLNATQTTSDAFNNTMNACKGTVDLFFLSLNTGDFSAFNEGISATIAKLKELEELRDSLGDAKLTESFVSSKTEAKFSELEAIIRNPKNSIKVREKAFKELQALIAEYKKDLSDVQLGNKEVLLKSLNVKFPKNKWTEQDIDSYLSIYNNDFSSRLRAKQFRTYKGNIDELEKNKYKYTSVNTGHGVYTEKTLDYSVLQQIDALKLANPFFEKMRLLNIDNDTSRKQMLEDYRYGVELKRKGAELDKRSLELQANIEAAKKQNITPKQVVKDKPKEYVKDLTTIKGIQEEIKRIEEEKAHAEFSQIPALNEQISRLQTIKKLASEGKLTPDGKGVSVIDSGAPTLPNFTPVKEDNGFNKGLKGLSKNAKLMNNLARSIRGVGDAMAATGNQSKAMARSMAMVNAAASIAMMISIMIEKSKTSLTIWDWIAGITAGTATVVAMAAQLRSINTSRFAEGGIVGGNNTIGDMNLVRVNSGEMILNTRQQRNLFNLLNNGGSTGSSASQVEFKIRGKELVGVLDNYNNKMNKVR